jgi:hypothetical protein
MHLMLKYILCGVTAAVVTVSATTAGAVAVTSVRTVNLLQDNSPVASPWFTLGTNGTTTFAAGTDINNAYPLQQSITLKGQNSPVPGGAVQAGQVNALTTHGTYTLTGNSTYAGGWIDGNGIPKGVVVKFNTDVTFSADAGSFLTLTGTAANGLGITQTQGQSGTIEPGETLSVSDVTVTGISFTGTPTADPGLQYAITPGTVGNFGPIVIRSANTGTAGATTDGFYEAGETAGLFSVPPDPSGKPTIGFGDATSGEGTVASHKIIENGFALNTDPVTLNTNIFARQPGAWTFKLLGGTLTTQAMAIKGIGYQYDVTYDVAATQVPIPGDYNQNGAVDAADYVLWRKGDLAADSNGDTIVDQTDYNFWVANFGIARPSFGGGSGLSGASVPEPSSIAILMLGLIGIYGCRRGGRS